MDNKIIRNVVVFIVVVILSGWIGVLVDSVLTEQPKGDSPGMGIWLVTPMLAAITMTIFSKGNWNDLGFKPNFKRNIKWYFIAALVFPVVTSIVLKIGVITDWIDLSTLDPRPFILVFSSTPLFSYLPPKLVKLNFNDWKLYLTVGSVWGIWHLPYFLVFLPETDIQAVLPVSRAITIIIMIITMILWSVMFIELYRVTKSIWPGVVLHMVEDSLINPLVISGFISIAAGKEILISPINGMITSILYLLVGLGIRTYRKQANQILLDR